MNNRKGRREKQLSVLRFLKSCSSLSSNTSFLPAADEGLHTEVSSSLLGQLLIPWHMVGCRYESSREECPTDSRWLEWPSARGYTIAGLSWSSCPKEVNAALRMALPPDPQRGVTHGWRSARAPGLASKQQFHSAWLAVVSNSIWHFVLLQGFRNCCDR